PVDPRFPEVKSLPDGIRVPSVVPSVLDNPSLLQSVWNCRILLALQACGDSAPRLHSFVCFHCFGAAVFVAFELPNPVLHWLFRRGRSNTIRDARSEPALDESEFFVA